MLPTAPVDIPQFYVQHADGSLEFNLHQGQDDAIYSPARFILVLAGAQSGKTVCGPIWLWDEIGRCGPGDYMCVAPSYPLMAKKLLPEFLRLFDTYLKLGTYSIGKRVFEFKDGKTNIYFGHAEDPESLESATLKGLWADECGQKKFRLASWEALQRRLAINRGRAFLTTTPYDLGWLKQQVHDRAKAKDPDYHVVNFNSLMNPAFPREEYERAKRTLPGWRFRMFYEGQFERPAGMIYDCFTDDMKIPRFTIPSDWKRYMGVDFGAINTAAVYLAEDPGTKRLYIYREYWQGGRTAKEHVQAMLQNEIGLPAMIVGGSKSEDQWRAEFRAAGLPIREPEISEVELGINRVYGCHAENGLVAFNDLHHYLDQKESYSRVLDDMGEPTEKIEDKESYHLCFVAGTMIETQRGPVPIEQVRLDDWAWTRAGLRPVVSLFRSGQRRLVRILLSNGSDLVGTNDHPVFVINKGFVRMDAIRYADTIAVCETQTLPAKQFRRSASRGSVTRIPNGCRIDGISAMGHEISTDTHGNSTTERFPLVMQSITRTATQAITQSATSNCRTAAGTLPTIIGANVLPESKPIWTGFVRSHQRGIDQRKAGNGIAITPNRGSPNGSQCPEHASDAEKPTYSHGREVSTNSVLRCAEPQPGANPVSITKSGSVRIAESGSLSTNTRAPSIARAHVLSRREVGKGMVYNLTVAGEHEYFANGVLVSNCDAERYIVGYLRGSKKKFWVR
jgi:terminase large subunit-like protein